MTPEQTQRFKELFDKGWRSLSKEERVEYSALKAIMPVVGSAVIHASARSETLAPPPTDDMQKLLNMVGSIAENLNELKTRVQTLENPPVVFVSQTTTSTTPAGDTTLFLSGDKPIPTPK